MTKLEIRKGPKPGTYHHGPEQRAKISAARKGVGHPRSAETRAKISAYQKGRPKSAEWKKMMSARMMGNRNGAATMWCGTWPEQVMAAILEHAGVEFEAQKWIGRVCVDFYLPESNSVIEVDGSRWHQDEKREVSRDAALLATGIAFVHHVNDDLLKEWWK
jgi:very-short-patch-repair endonuclease